MQIGGGVRVSDAFQSEAELVTHSNMRTVVLCLNFLCVLTRTSARNEMLASDATIGNAKLENVLKTTD